MLCSILPIIIFSSLSIITVCILYKLKPSHWYNTLLCFPAGMWYSYYKHKIDKILNNHYFSVFFLGLFLLFLLHKILKIVKYDSLFYGFYSIVFALIVILISIKIRFRNPLLILLGNHVFSIYILHRLILSIFYNINNNVNLYFVISFLLTILISISFDFLYGKISEKL